jgi:O-antigen/teichoic acid export membrane protein
VAPVAEPDLLATPAAGPAAVRGGVVRVAGYGAGVLLTVVSAAVLFRHLGVDASGEYVLVLALVTLFGGVTDAGLSTIGVRELSAHGGMERGALLGNLLGLRIAFTAAGVLLACAYAVIAGWDERLVAGTAIAGAGLLVGNVQNALATDLIADLRLGWVTAADFARQGVTAAGIVALALAGAALLPFFAVGVAAGLVALVLTARVVRGVPRPVFNLASWRTLLRDALPFALAAAVGAIYFRLAILLVEIFTSARETGYFGASFRVVEVLVIVPQLAIGAAFPIFARAASADRGRLHYAVQRSLDASLLIGTLVAVGLGVGAPFVIEVVAGAEFKPAADVLRLHALAFLGSFAAAVFGYTLLSLRLHRQVLVINAAALVGMVVFGAALIPAFGAEGAAGATAISEAVLALTGAVCLARSGMVAPLSARAIPRLAAAAVVGVGVPVAIGLPALPAAVLAVVLCAGAALLLGAVPDELLDELRRLRRRASRAEGTPT